ncbi:MAG TPA: alkaline phosphatase family protein [Actinomycetota bacterium]|nr:alkaline phosphatase family protein [Actinomycetota bacterium]
MNRFAVVIAAALVVVVVALVALNREAHTFDPGSAPTLDDMGDRVGAEVMQLVYDGNVPDRTGEILLVGKPDHYLGPDVDLTQYGTATPVTFTSHPNPWSYLARVPLVVVPARGTNPCGSGCHRSDHVDLTALAPTYARLMHTPFSADGSPLPGLDYDGTAPKLIFTIVIDGGGWNVLQRFPDAWPNIRALMDRGIVYDNALNGSFPAQTGSIHGNIGTGDYPRTHGVAYNYWFEDADPQYLRVPTIGDVWDQRNDNRAIVGTISVLSNHLAMIGHGAQMAGGDHDVGVIWDDENQRWFTNTDYYSIPKYMTKTHRARLERYEAQNDDRDGLHDGTWFGNAPESLTEGLKRSSAPSFEHYEGDDIVRYIRSHPLGRDDITDLFYVQFKSPDQAGHIWNMDYPEIGDVLKEADNQIGRIVATLDDVVGAENYVLALTADHGQQPLAEGSGGWMINSKEVERDVEREFDVEARVRSHQLNITSLNGASIEDIARYLGSYTLGENIPDSIPGADRVPEARRNETLFAGAFPTGWLADLTPEQLSDFGDSSYPEGSLFLDGK